MGRHEEAEAMLGAGIDGLVAAFGEKDFRVAYGRTGLARLFRDTARPDRAGVVYTAVIEAAGETYGWCHPNTRRAMMELFEMFFGLGRMADAGAVLVRAADGVLSDPGGPSCAGGLASVCDRLDEAYAGQGFNVLADDLRNLARD